MHVTQRFWGEQGRVGLLRAGPWSGKYIFAYPDTMTEWWTVVIEPSPYKDVPGDMYFQGNNVKVELDAMWQILWLPRNEQEELFEREHFGWRPLVGEARWMPD